MSRPTSPVQPLGVLAESLSALSAYLLASDGVRDIRRWGEVDAVEEDRL